MSRTSVHLGSFMPVEHRDLTWPEIPTAPERALEAETWLAERELLSSLGGLLETTARVCRLLHSAIELSHEIHSLPARRQGNVAALRFLRPSDKRVPAGGD